MKENQELDVKTTWIGARDQTILALLAVSLPLLVVDSYLTGLLLILLFNGAIFLLCYLDYLKMRDQVAQFEWHWKYPKLCVEGIEADVELSLYNPCELSLPLSVQACWPFISGVSKKVLEGKCERSGWTNFTFPARPIQAGTHHCEGIRLRVYGPAGFVFADFSIPIQDSFNVSLALVKSGQKKRRRLNVPLSTMDGPHTQRRKAAAGAFTSLRFYQQGDPMRLVDWKATSRRGRLVSREFNPEKQLHTYIALECGRGMARLHEGRTWFQHSVSALLTVIRVLLKEGRSASLYVFDSKLRLAEARISSPRQFPLLAKTLMKVNPSEIESDYALLRKALAHVRRRGHELIVVSALSPKAFLEDRDGSFGKLSKHFKTTVARLEDPARRVMPCIEYFCLEQFYRSAYLRMEANQEQAVNRELRSRKGQLLPTEPNYLSVDLRNHLYLV